MSWKLSLVKFQPSWQAEHWALVLKTREAALGCFGNGLLVALNPGVERRSLGHHRPFVGRDGFGKRIDRHSLVGEGCCEKRLVFSNR